MRKLTTTSDNIFSLISCAKDYGFDRDVLFDAFREMLGSKLSFEEIEIYSRSVGDMDDYGEEDYLITKERLINFKNNYCK